jgi:hypothetical protein
MSDLVSYFCRSNRSSSSAQHHIANSHDINPYCERDQYGDGGDGHGDLFRVARCSNNVGNIYKLLTGVTARFHVSHWDNNFTMISSWRYCVSRRWDAGG